MIPPMYIFMLLIHMLVPTHTNSYFEFEPTNLHIELVHRLDVLQIHIDFVWYEFNV
jgi:hypothetical protein